MKNLYNYLKEASTFFFLNEKRILMKYTYKIKHGLYNVTELNYTIKIHALCQENM